MGSKKKTGIHKELDVSPELADVIGTDRCSRPDVMAKVWKYIKKHGLQDEDNRRMINPDDLLSEVLGSKQVSMFDLTKKISKHLS